MRNIQYTVSRARIPVAAALEMGSRGRRCIALILPEALELGRMVSWFPDSHDRLIVGVGGRAAWGPIHVS